MEGGDVTNVTGMDTEEPQVVVFLKTEQLDQDPLDDYSSQFLGGAHIDIGDVKQDDTTKELKVQELPTDSSNYPSIGSNSLAKTIPMTGLNAGKVSGKTLIQKSNSSLKRFTGRPKKATDVGEPFQCRHCHRSFRKYWSLKSHLRTHTGEMPFKCTICDRAFFERANLLRHYRLKIHEQDLPAGIRSKSRRPSTEELQKKLGLPLEADQDSLERSDHNHEGNEKSKGVKKEIISSEETIGDHIKQETAQEPMTSLQSETSCKCNICDKILFTQTDHTVHMRLHEEEKPHRCSLCNMAFATLSNFTFHFRSHGVDPYKCHLCGVQFPFSGRLEKHILETHSKEIVPVRSHRSEKRYKCSTCYKSYPTLRGLTKHIEVHKW